MRHSVLAIAAFAVPLVIVACARAPEPRTNATTDSNLEPGADASGATPATPRVDPSSDASAGGDARVPVPGLPMPQQFPRFVWDAAGAPRDGAAR
jgi:hypothetical protein